MDEFTLALDELRFVGEDLHRPECVLARPDGTLWISDGRGGVTRRAPDGTQTLITPFSGESNGMALDAVGNLIIANISEGRVDQIDPEGNHTVLLNSFEGEPLGAVNFTYIDRRGRLWVTVSTKAVPWFGGFAERRSDGYILLIEDGTPRLVADGLMFTNEIRIDEQEEYLYVAETGGCRISRFRLHEDGSLTDREVYVELGRGGYPDGIAFDQEGNLWVTLPVINAVGYISPDRLLHIVVQEVNEAALTTFIEHLESGTLTVEDFMACGGQKLTFLTSVTFAGDDLRTVYVGSLGLPHLLTFRAPVAGVPLSHWT